MSKYGDEQSHDNQSHGDRHLDAQVKIVNIEIQKNLGCDLPTREIYAVYNELFTFSDANAYEIVQSPEEFLHFWICFDVDVVSRTH